MEKFALALQSQPDIDERLAGRLVPYEYEILNEIAAAIRSGGLETLQWFAGFGDSLRAILMNVHAYRKGVEFGFTEIAFDQYGWFVRPRFLDYEVVKLGNTARYGEYSEIRIGRGVNGIWSFALSYSFGCAGGSSALSVYDPQFASREAVLTTALSKLKVMFTEKIGATDTTNYKQDVILKTLKAIEGAQVNMVQLSLF